MALQPILTQTPRVSLIGGKELPKASGAGVPTPNIAGPLQQLSSELQRKSEENDVLASQIKGTNIWETEYDRAQSAGIGPDGMYKSLGPLPTGNKYVQAAYFEARAKTAAADIRTIVSDNFNRIQSDFNVPSAVRAQKMAEYAKGSVERLDPLLRGAAREEAAREIEGRVKAMAADDEARNKKAMTDGWIRQIDNETNLAMSAASANGDPAPHLKRLYDIYDQQAAAGYITEQDARTMKVQKNGIIAVTRDARALGDMVMFGDVSLDEMENLKTAIVTGGDYTVEGIMTTDPSLRPATDPSQPGVGVTEGLVRRFNTTEMKLAYGDPAFAEQLAARLGVAIDRKRQWLKDKSVGLDYQNALAAVANTDQQLPPTMVDDHNKAMGRIFETGQLDTGTEAEKQMAANLVIQTTLQAKVMSPVVSNWLINTINGNDFQKSAAAVEIWNSISNYKRGNTNIGTVIRRGMDADAIATLDTAAAAMGLASRPGSNTSAQDWADWQKTLIADPKQIGRSITQFDEEARENDEGSFNMQTSTRWREDYGTGDMPRQMEQQFTLTYTTYFNRGGGMTRQEAFDKAWEETSKNWKKSSIFYGGYAPTKMTLAPPPGYETDVPWSIFSKDETAWYADYTGNILNKMDDVNSLVFPDGMDSYERRQFDKAMNNPISILGPNAGSFQLMAASGNRDATQYNVVLNMDDGSRMILRTKDADGNAVPVTLDIDLVHAHLTSKGQAKQALDETRSELQQRSNALLGYHSQAVATWMGGIEGQPAQAINWDDPAVQEMISDLTPAEREAWRKQQQSAADVYLKAATEYNAIESTIPVGVDLAPEILTKPKAGGVDVTIGAIKAIEAILPTPDGGQFLLDVAAVESNYGQAELTFRSAGDRGIFQINDGTQGAYREIMRRARIQGDPIQIAAAKLKPLGVDIVSTTREDLDKPLVNAAFARLYFMASPVQISSDPEQNARLWKDHYNTRLGLGTVQGFIQKAGQVKMPPNTAPASPTRMISGSAGMVTDMGGAPDPQNFRNLKPYAQDRARMLSGAFGMPLRITPHGGTQGDARKSTSQHHAGTAIDIYVDDMSDAEKNRLIVTAIGLGYKGIGGYGAGDGKGTLHFDLRAGDGNGPMGVATWWRNKPGVDDNYTTGPAWFSSAITAGGELLRKRASA